MSGAQTPSPLIRPADSIFGGAVGGGKSKPGNSDAIVETRYQEVRTDFRTLIEYGASLSEELANRVAPNDREFYASHIFAKLLGHSISLLHLSPSGLHPHNPSVTELWDLCSIGSLARVLIESFDALAYVAIHGISDKERTFRISLRRLHADERRQEMLRLIGSTAPGVNEVAQQIKILRTELMEHPMFSEASSQFRKNVSNGNSPPFHLSKEERCRLSGVSHEYYTSAYMHLSAYVHTFPFAIQQLDHFKAGDPDSLRILSVPIQYATGFLAKAIEGMQSVFPLTTTTASKSASKTLGIWTGIVRAGVRDIG